MAEMVWCQSCKVVVWANDHQIPVDLRGICNMFQLPCPRCGTEGNFDGWGDRRTPYQTLKDNILEHDKTAEVYDWWSLMKYLAKFYKMEWNPSGDNRWFPKKE